MTNTSWTDLIFRFNIKLCQVAREKTEIKLFALKLQPKQIRKRCSVLCVGVEGTEASPSQPAR